MRLDATDLLDLHPKHWQNIEAAGCAEVRSELNWKVIGA